MKKLTIIIDDESSEEIVELGTDVDSECTEDSKIERESSIKIFIVSILIFSLIFSFAAAMSSSFIQPTFVQHEDLPEM
jgi:hypothetical protein